MNEIETTTEFERPTKKRKLLLSEIALFVECAAVFAPFVAWFCFMLAFFEFIYVIALLALFYTFAGPIIGIILGIVSLCSEKRSKRNIACSVAAISLPFIVVAVIIILFSTRVLVIRFM